MSCVLLVEKKVRKFQISFLKDNCQVSEFLLSNRQIISIYEKINMDGNGKRRLMLKMQKKI